MDATHYAEMKRQRNEINAQLKAAAKDVFKEQSKGLFDAHPLLESFSWTQYTPYFNDGEECVFRSNTAYPQIKICKQPSDAEGEEPVKEEDEDNEFYDKRRYSGSHAILDYPNTPQEKAGCAVIDFLKTFDKDELREMFDNHVKVSVTRAGVDVDEYDHD